MRAVPVVNRRRLSEYATKGLHLVAREVGQAPEHRRARALSSGAPQSEEGAPRVVFFTPRDWTAHVQWEAVLAQALRLRGADVHVITCGGGLEICDRANTWEAPPMPCRTCVKYVDDAMEAHRLSSVSLRDGWQDDDPGDWPDLDELSLGQLVDVDGEGLPLGELTRIPVSWFLLRASLQDDPLAAQTWRAFLRSARRITRGVRSALDRLQPDVVVLLNGLFMFDAIAWAVCRERGIDVVTYERGFIKETLLFRRNEVAALTRMDDLWPRFRDVALTADQTAVVERYLDDRRHGRRTIDRYWDDVEFVRPAHERTGRLVALFPNLTWDSAVIGQTVAFASIQEWLTAAVEYFAARPEHQLVIRLHPAETKLPGKQTREPLGGHLDERFPVLPPNVRVIAPDDNTSSYPLMEACDVGLVFTSTTGLELAMTGKPVIVAGRTHYRDKGFTLDAESPEHFGRLLDAVLADPVAHAPDPEVVQRYAHLFFFRAPFDSYGVVEHVPGLAEIRVRDLSELAPGANASLDRLCDGILGGGDLLPSECADG